MCRASNLKKKKKKKVVGKHPFWGDEGSSVELAWGCFFDVWWARHWLSHLHVKGANLFLELSSSSSHLFLINPTAARALTKLNCKKPPFYTLSTAAAKTASDTTVTQSRCVSCELSFSANDVNVVREFLFHSRAGRVSFELCEMLCELQPRAFVPHKSRFFNFCLSTLLLLSFFPPQSPPPVQFLFVLWIGRKKKAPEEWRKKRERKKFCDESLLEWKEIRVFAAVSDRRTETLYTL